MIIRRGKNQRGGCQLQSGKEFKQPVRLENVLGWTDLSVAEAIRERGLFIKDWNAEVLGLAFGISFQRDSFQRDSRGILTDDTS